MKITIFQYKCRLCKEVWDETLTSDENATIVLTVCGREMLRHSIETQPKLIRLHSLCEDKKGYGVGDLIGVTIKE